MEKVLDFLATNENISVINILPILNSKHSSYWGGKLTLSQLRLGHGVTSSPYMTSQLLVM